MTNNTIITTLDNIYSIQNNNLNEEIIKKKLNHHLKNEKVESLISDLYNFTKKINYKKKNHNILLYKLFINKINSKIHESRHYYKSHIKFLINLFVYVLKYYKIQIDYCELYVDDELDMNNQEVSDNDSVNGSVNGSINGDLIIEPTEELVTEPINETINNNPIIEPTEQTEEQTEELVEEIDNNQNYYDNINKISITNDEVFLYFFNSFLWNENLLYFFTIFIIQLDDVITFEYVYNYAINNGIYFNLQNILENLGKIISEKNFILYDMQYDCKLSLSCYNIFNYVINKLDGNSSKQLVLNFFDNYFFKSTKKTKCVFHGKDNLIRLNCDYFEFGYEKNKNPDNDIFWIYKYFKNNNLLDGNIISLLYKHVISNVSLKKTTLELFSDILIKEFKVNPIEYLTFALEKNNYNFIDIIIRANNLSQSNLKKIIEHLSKQHLYSYTWIPESKITQINLLNKLLTKNNLNKLDGNYLYYIIYISSSYHNILVFKKIIEYIFKNNLYDSDLLVDSLKNSKQRYFKIATNTIKKYNQTLSFDNQQLFQFSLNNEIMLSNIIKNNCISSVELENVFEQFINIMLKNKGVKSKCTSGVLMNIIKKTKDLTFSLHICDILYEKKCYNALCKYLQKTSPQHGYTYKNIKKYKNIIYSNEIISLLFKLKLTIDDAHEIIFKIKNNKQLRKWFAKRQSKKIHKICITIFKLNIKPYDDININDLSNNNYLDV
jgi:hypothetical protein